MRICTTLSLPIGHSHKRTDGFQNRVVWPHGRRCRRRPVGKRCRLPWWGEQPREGHERGAKDAVQGHQPQAQEPPPAAREAQAQGRLRGRGRGRQPLRSWARGRSRISTASRCAGLAAGPAAGGNWPRAAGARPPPLQAWRAPATLSGARARGRSPQPSGREGSTAGRAHHGRSTRACGSRAARAVPLPPPQGRARERHKPCGREPEGRAATSVVA